MDVRKHNPVWHVYVLAIVLLCLVKPVFAQIDGVWTLDTLGFAGPVGTLDVTVLEKLSVGDFIEFQVNASADPYEIRIDRIAQLNNGDRTWYGSITNTGLDYALVITVGDQTAHLILTSPFGIFQLFGIAEEEGVYSGNFNHLEDVRDEVSKAETVVPGQDPGSDPDSSAEFSINQVVSRTSAPIGAVLTFDLDFTYRGASPLPDQFVNIYFVLENTDLESLPQDCEVLETTENQPVLNCYLGDFQQDQEKHLSFSVRTSGESHPWVWSTATVGEVRSDVIVDIYRDIITDSDQDGISDYNEELLGTDAFNGLSPADDATAVIDVLVLYTEDIDALYLGEVDTRINQLFNVANKIFSDSRTGIVLRAVGTRETSYTPTEDLQTDLKSLTYQEDEAFSDLPRLRDLYGADLVVLFRKGEVNGLCGLANLGGQGTYGDLSAEYQKDFAYSVINIDCGDDSVLAHEVGHNLGLAHSRLEDPEGGTLPYAAGYGEDTRFVTVMAFPEDFDVVNRLYRFSDPERDCGTPISCGRDKEDEDNGADAVSSLKLVKHQVSHYYNDQESRIGNIETYSTQTGFDTPIIGLGAYTDDSSDFDSVFPADKKVSLRMKITPRPDQVGRRFVTHVVIVSGRANVYQGNSAGNLIYWDGSLQTLEVVKSFRLMNEMELFDLLEDVDFQALGLGNAKVNIFAGYQMSDTRELIYGVTPLTLHIGE